MPLVGQRMHLAVAWMAVVMSGQVSTVRAETETAGARAVPITQEAADVNGPDAAMPELTIAVKDNGMKLGDVVVVASVDGSIRIRRDSLLVAVRPVFRETALQELEAALPESDLLDPHAIAAAGLKNSYNSNDLEFHIMPTVEQRPRGEIDGVARSNIQPSDFMNPATINGFLNARLGFGYERQDGEQGHFEYPAIMLDGAGRWQGVVVEGEALLQTDGSLARQSTRFVYDMPEEALRITAGDLTLRPGGSFSVPPLLGIAIERSYAELQPTRNIRPTGKRSFRLDRPSEVQVLINGSEARRLRLQPGEYDLDDLPLTSGANEVQLKIKDDFGEEETIDFSILFNRALLDAGVSEWTLGAGVRANAGLGSPVYDEQEQIMVGSYRLGLSEVITGSVSAQASKHVTLAGSGALLQTPIGLAAIDAALSRTKQGETGWSASAHLDLETENFWEDLNSAHFGIDLISKDFANSLEQAPHEGDRLRIGGGIGHRLPGGVSASVSGYYQIADEKADQGFGVGVSLNRAISQELSASVSGSYEHREGGSDVLSGMTLFARLNFRPTTDSYLTLQHDRIEEVTSLAGGTNFQQGSRRAAVDVEWEHGLGGSGDDSETLANANVYYADSRIEVNASHGRSFDRLISGATSRRTQVNAGLGFAFADDKAAFGRPIRGQYAIVDAHSSLAGSDIQIDPFQDFHKAGTDNLGPILVSDLSAYTRTTVAYEVDNLPVGYDTGTGAFEFFAPYKSGFAVMVGSDFSVTAVGVLTDVDGNPVPLQAGVVSAAQFPEKQFTIFTNAEGMFTASGLKSGEWSLAMNGGSAARYQLRIPDTAGAFIELGVLRPEG